MSNSEFREVTGAEAGLSGVDQILIALREIVRRGGEAKMAEISEAVEGELGNYSLSDQGRASLRRLVNWNAVKAGYLYPHDSKAPGWRITPEGKELLAGYSKQSEEVIDVDTGRESQFLNRFNLRSGEYKMSQNNIEVIPSARRLMGSLRDLGYDFPTAIAELIDNSIEAKAKAIFVDVKFAGKDSWVSVADNGTGMSSSELKEGMRFGSEGDYDEDSLGKFGLGLKTASISQCRSLTVISRQSPTRANLAAYSWDLDHVNETDRWEIIPRTGKEISKETRGYLAKSTGTVVIWNRLDRILNYQNPEGIVAMQGLASMCRDLEEHLAMVFHKFLAGEIRGRKININLNGNKIKPWDPFAKDEEKTVCLESAQFQLINDGTEDVIKVVPYILPHQDDFSSPEAFRKAAGPKKWNRQQGFYVYREGRLIQSGGWSNQRTLDEHTKLSRISLDFENTHDDAFKTDIAKMKIQIPRLIKDDLKKIIDPAVKSARKAYDRRDGNKGNGKKIKKQWTLHQVESRLKKLADQDERRTIIKLFSRLRSELEGEE